MGDLFGVRPWEMDQMRLGEIRACNEYVDKLNKAARG
jgi:hypothetical protein